MDADIAEEAEEAEDRISKEAQRLRRRILDPEVQAFVNTAPPPSTWTAEQTLTLRRLWNQPRAAS